MSTTLNFQQRFVAFKKWIVLMMSVIAGQLQCLKQHTSEAITERTVPKAGTTGEYIGSHIGRASRSTQSPELFGFPRTEPSFSR